MADTLTGKALSLYAILKVLLRARMRTKKISKTSIIYHFFRISYDFPLSECCLAAVIDA